MDRRTSTVEPAHMAVFQLDELTVDPLAGEMYGPAGREQLDPKVMEVLVLLAQRAGNVVLRQELLEKLWPGMVVSDDALSRCIYQLRRHLTQASGSDRYKALLETLPKRGYRLKCNATVVSSATSVEAARQPPTQPSNTLDSQQGSNHAFTTVGTGKRRLRARLGAVVVILLGTAATTVWFWNRSDLFWQTPLANATFRHLTDFESAEQEAAISRDGKFVAFLSDRDGPTDLWVSQIGTGEFHNLTQGRAPEVRNPAVRTVGFSPDGSDVTVWARVADSAADSAAIHLWTAAIRGGPLRPFLEDVAEVAWSSDGTRMIYRRPTSGDPIFVTEPNEKVGRQIFVAPPGWHCHFPLWSPDDAFIYFVYGLAPNEMDIWRIAPTGGEPERITFHNSRVAYPVLLDKHTLLYLASAEDGSGPWLYGMNVERRVSRRISVGAEQYTSLSGSADGRRLVATRTTPRASLWRVRISDRVAEESDASRILVPTGGGHSPRLGPSYLLYLSPSEGADGIWKLVDDTATALWSGRHGRVVAGPEVEPNGHRIAFPATIGEKTRLYMMNADGTAVRVLAEDLDVRGAAAWSPDGQAIAIGAEGGSGVQLFTISAVDGIADATVDEYSVDPVWSPDGRFMVYRGPELGPSFAIKAVTAKGEPYPVPNLVLPRGAGRFHLSYARVPYLRAHRS